MIRTLPAVATIIALAAPGVASAQGVAAARQGFAPLAAPRPVRVAPEVSQVQRRGGWEVGAVLGGIGGAAFGYMVVVMYNDGRAEKMGTGREVLTIAGAAAIGAGLGAAIQSLID